MRFFLFSYVLFSSITIGMGQCPEMEVFLTSQADIDNFATTYPNCTELTHDLNIDGQNSNITNLLGLSELVSAQYLFIQGTQVNTLEGLHNLVSIVDLALWGNSNLQNLEGLTQLQSAGGLEIWINSGIQDLTGIDNLQSVDRLSLFANPNLSDINHLSFLTTLSSLTIGGNGFSQLTGLENLQSVDGDISITDELLLNVDELSSLQSVGGSIYIAFLPLLTDVSALNQVNSADNLYFLECNSLANLTGLQNIQTVSGTLRIGFMPQLTDISALSGLTSAQALEIYENPLLPSLTGLEQLMSVTQNVYVMDNLSLNDVSSINNIVPGGQSEVVVARNPLLSVCDNDFICGVIFDPQIPEFITDNAVGCGSVPQVAARCLLASEHIDLSEAIVISPNPVQGVLTIQLDRGIQLQHVEVYSMLGQLLQTLNTSHVDFSNLPDGMYLVKITTDRGSITQKVVKN